MADMSSILSKPASEVKKAPNKVGTFLAQVASFTTDKPTTAGNPQVVFKLNILSGIDVESSLLAQLTFPSEFTYYQVVTEKSEWRLKDFLEKTLQIPESGRTLGEMLSEAPGKLFHAHFVERPSTKPGDNQFYENIQETSPVA